MQKAPSRKPLISPSTRAFLREGRQARAFSMFDLLHGYVYARWPYLYIGIGTGQHRIAKMAEPLIRLYGKVFPPRPDVPSERRTRFEDTYHGKVMPLEAVKELVQVRRDLTVLDVGEPILPYTRARDLILQNPDHIVALDCPCRAARANPCLPLDVCLIVGEPFASFVSEHHPNKTRWITSQEAVDILQAEDQRGHVHHAFFKDAMLGRFYAICNCCSCCCGAMHAQRHGTHMLTASGFSARVDEDLCAGCGVCVDVCQFHAIQVDTISQVDQQACMGCGVCVSHCATGALSLVRDPSKGEPLEIFKLIEQAA